MNCKDCQNYKPKTKITPEPNPKEGRIYVYYDAMTDKLQPFRAPASGTAMSLGFNIGKLPVSMLDYVVEIDPARLYDTKETGMPAEIEQQILEGTKKYRLILMEDV